MPLHPMPEAAAQIATAQELIIPEVVLSSKGPMSKPLNMVYSTNPHHAIDSHGTSYCVKGEDDIGIVIAELLGHMLAGFVGIPVPHFAVGRFTDDGAPVFASGLIENAVREVEILLGSGKVKNMDVLSRVIALDVWLANNDRNCGNLLGRVVGGDEDFTFELVAIDFEKSATVRKKSPLIEIAMMPPKSFWPRDLLGSYCKKHARISDAALSEFGKVTNGQIENAVKTAFAVVRVTDVEKIDSICHVLRKRRDDLEKLVKVEWN